MFYWQQDMTLFDEIPAYLEKLFDYKSPNSGYQESGRMESRIIKMIQEQELFCVGTA